MQRERRRDPYPWTWEIPLGIGIGVLLLLMAGIQLGRSAANLVAGAGWTWPATDMAGAAGPFRSPVGGAFWSSLPRVLAGHADAGLSPSPPASDLAAPTMLWSCLVLTELLLLAGCGWGGARGYQRWGSGRMKGMATAKEAEALLGITRLRKVATYVRPDLYGRSTTQASVTSARTVAGYDANNDSAVLESRSPWLLPGRRSSRRRVRR